jgi:putative ABC transport system permease protein
MNIWQSIIEALESLTTNKMRSGLTILGIVIGVGAVIAMLAIGTGAENSILGEIEGIGTNLLFVTPGGSDEITNPKPLTLLDAVALADPLQAPAIGNVAPALQGRAEVTYGGESTSTSLVGVTPAYADVRNLAVMEGEFISEINVTGRSAVVILGTDVAEALFGRTSGFIGERVNIAGQPFRVVGVLEELGGGGFGSEDDQVLVPLTTAQTRLLSRATLNEVDVIYVQASTPEAVTQAIEDISLVLSSRHRTPIGEEDFEILSQQDILDVASSVTGILTILLGGIAGISLLVGGIGIMNIMLVSVVERTREIGLRKALGARKRDILTQFLVESALLSLVGGLVGILLGWGLSVLVGVIAANSGTAINPVVGVDAVLLATLFSTAVGLFFGLYPANRAAGLEPVEALRSE